jgi:hypothetical protein
MSIHGEIREAVLERLQRLENRIEECGQAALLPSTLVSLRGFLRWSTYSSHIAWDVVLLLSTHPAVAGHWERFSPRAALPHIDCRDGAIRQRQ